MADDQELLRKVIERSSMRHTSAGYSVLTPAESPPGPPKSQTTIWIVIGAGLAMTLALLMIATGGGGGAGAPVAARSPQQECAENALTVMYASITSDAAALQGLIAPAQLPIPEEVLSGMQSQRAAGAGELASIKRTMQWTGAEAVMRLSMPSEPEEFVITAVPTVITADRVDVSLHSTQDDGLSGTVLGMVQTASGWKVEQINGEGLWDAY